MKDKDQAFWIIVSYQGEYTAIGPYSRSGAENMYERTTKGDVHIHPSWYTGKHDHEKVIDEYKAGVFANA